MTPDELRETLSRAGLSQRGAAAQLDINERTMRRYCSGDLQIPLVVQYALFWIAYARR